MTNLNKLPSGTLFTLVFMPAMVKFHHGSMKS